MRILLLAVLLYPSLLKKTTLWVALFFSCANAFATPTFSCVSPSIVLYFETVQACVEVVQDLPALERGLMFRQTLDEDSGMLFVFPKSGYYSMWMKETPLSLSVAFINDEGRVINIDEMKALTLDYHFPPMPARYVIEMPSHWFEHHRIFPGHFVHTLTSLNGDSVVRFRDQ
jgi:uncharacterized membrane protein (UPF0127 family)